MATTRPLVPEDRFRSPQRSPQHLVRACFAAVRAAARGERNPAVTARSLYAGDSGELAALLVARAAIAGASTTVPSWAGTLLTSAVGDFVTALTASAAAALIPRGVTVSVTEGVPVKIPIRATAPTAGGYIGEGSPIPLRAWNLTTADLSVRKVAALVVMSKELARYSDAPAIFEAMLIEESALSLDAAYFDATTGLLAGLVAGTGSAVMVNDLAKLAEAVGAGGSGQVVFVMGPGRAAAAQVRMPAEATATVLASLAVPETRVICVDPLSLAHGFGANPEITTTEEALLHMEGTTPLQIASGPQGSGVLATPSQSMFQTGQIAMRMLLDIAFCKRRSNAVAYLDGATW